MPRERAFAALRGHAPVRAADTVLCMYPALQCGLFASLNRSLLIVATNRIDQVRRMINY